MRNRPLIHRPTRRPGDAARPWMRLAAVALLGFGLAVAGPAMAQAQPTGEQTLTGALARAYDDNPTLRAQRDSLRATNERLAQALAGGRPTVEATGSVSARQTEVPGRRESINPAEIGITVRQPLYLGGRTEANVEVAENAIRAARSGLEAMEQRVLQSVVEAYMNVVRDQAVLGLAQNNQEVLERQLRATRDRFTVGEITRTDVSLAEARVAEANANRIAAEADLRAARATYEQVVGIAPGFLEMPPLPPGLPGSLEETVEQARSQNPTVISADFTQRSARANIDAAFADLLPQVNLEAGLSRAWNQSSTVSRQDTARIGATVRVPLYQGGAPDSRTREARHVANQRTIEVEEARRSAIEQAVRSWELFSTSAARIDALEAQIRAAEVALEGVRQEAQVGARTVLDQLDAERELLNARVNLVRAQRDRVVAAHGLLSAVGRLTARQLDLPVGYYDVERDYQAARDRWWGTDIGN